MRSAILATALALALLPGFARAADAPADSDGDGLVDRLELAFASDPAAADTDGDPSAPYGRSGQAADSDGDSLSDALEAKFKTNPNNPDSDSDGYRDGLEVSVGYSPTSTDVAPLEKRIEIDLGDQKLRQYLGDVVLNEFSISSGRPGMSTPVGEFKVLNKHPKAWSKMAGLWMPYWMAFTAKGHGIHELPVWPSGYREGAAHLGTAVSHGCVRLGVGAAKTLYDWAPVGTKIVISK